MTTAVAPVARNVEPGTIERYEREGYLLVRGLLSADEAAEIRDAFMALNANGPVAGLSEQIRWNGDAKPGITYDPADPLAFYPRMMNPHRHLDKAVGALSLKYLLDARIEPYLAALLGDEPIAAQSMFYFKPPGARGQDFHQDNFYLRVKPGSCLAAWVAIDDCDEGNGGMMVVPTTQTMDVACPQPTTDKARFFTNDHVPVPAGLEKVPCNMKAGDVLFFNGSLIHGSYPNTSKDRFRRSFICHYVPRGCAEVAHWYRPLLDFRGQEVVRAPAEGGGPCGEAQPLVKGPH